MFVLNVEEEGGIMIKRASSQTDYYVLGLEKLGFQVTVVEFEKSFEEELEDWDEEFGEKEVEEWEEDDEDEWDDWDEDEEEEEKVIPKPDKDELFD